MEEDNRLLSNSSALTVFPIVLSLVSIPTAIVNGFIVLVLPRCTSVAIPVRVPLINLLVANLLAAVIMFCSTLTSVVLALSDATEPPLPLCRFGLWLYNVTVETRLLGLLLFSVMAFQTAACGMRKIQAKWLVLSLVAAWVIATITHIDILVPPIYGVHYAGKLACFPTYLEGYREYQEVIRLTWTVIRIAVLLLVCIFIPLPFCYTKRNTSLEGHKFHYSKTLVKFAAFLITGNVLNILSLVMPWIVSRAFTRHDIVGAYFAYAVGVLSSIPTPILVVVFLQPVQKELYRIFCSMCWKDQEAIPMQQAVTAMSIN